MFVSYQSNFHMLHSYQTTFKHKIPIAKLIVITISIMSIPIKSVIPSLTFSPIFKPSIFAVYRVLTPCTVIFPIINMGKIFVWASQVSTKSDVTCAVVGIWGTPNRHYSTSRCDGGVLRHLRLRCRHRGILVGETARGVAASVGRSGGFRSFHELDAKYWFYLNFSIYQWRLCWVLW